jgi:hypothetical protein
MHATCSEAELDPETSPQSSPVGLHWGSSGCSGFLHWHVRNEGVSRPVARARLIVIDIDGCPWSTISFLLNHVHEVMLMLSVVSIPRLPHGMANLVYTSVHASHNFPGPLITGGMHSRLVGASELVLQTQPGFLPSCRPPVSLHLGKSKLQVSMKKLRP